MANLKLETRNMLRHSALLALLLATPALAQQSTLIIRSDADCALTVNGMAQGSVTAGSAKAVAVGPGEQLVECAAGGAKAEQVLEVFPGAQKVVQIALASKVAVQARFKADANRVLDTRTGLTWLAADNGYDIDWNAATSYCAGVSPGTWELPRMSELQAISGPDGAGRSPLFKVWGWHWSNESHYENGSAKAWAMNLYDGRRFSPSVSSRHYRALCVRRSP